MLHQQGHDLPHWHRPFAGQDVADVFAVRPGVLQVDVTDVAAELAPK